MTRGVSKRRSELLEREPFQHRHLGLGPEESQILLDSLGYASMAELIDDALPADIRLRRPLNLQPSCDESEALAELGAMMASGQPRKSLIGMGYYGAITPQVLRRNLLENPSWYTAYTPYQAEISQGRLETLLNFQHMVADLTGLPCANASLLDEATAAAEAMGMCARIFRGRRKIFWADAGCHPQTLAVLRTRASTLEIDLRLFSEAPPESGPDCCGALLQWPRSDGEVYDLRPALRALSSGGALTVVACDLLALTLLEPPGAAGADIAVGSSQRFGMPMGCGGPHAAFIATGKRHARQLPGRIIGLTRDRAGQTALRMALQTREQHIRREKATSNICTAQALPAMMAACYAMWHGPQRLAAIARRVHALAGAAACGLRELGFAVRHQRFFDTLRVDVDAGEGREILRRAAQLGYDLRDQLDSGWIGLSFDETCEGDMLAALLAAFAGRPQAELQELAAQSLQTVETRPPVPAPARREAFLTHPAFNSHHTETRMMRRLRELAARDIALDRSMIALGSCTMKLNASAEMAPITWPELADAHPYAPDDQLAGYRQLTARLEAMLAEVTGLPAVSLQPNAGSQGEYAGLLAIRRYHESRAETRDLCLIPVSAHGTNPASAVMCGFQVESIACRENGDICLEDFQAKAAACGARLGAVMVTYPSTHGVFEESIREICRIAHEQGALVYLDGANFNALVGLARPGDFGADVMHINLHKTFCIPHGGGGPGMGPIAACERLAPHLPVHPLEAVTDPLKAVANPQADAVAAAPWGSACLLAISWCYIRMMGADGLRAATETAILNANYLSHRLERACKTLFRGARGNVAHECVVDLRPLSQKHGVSIEDVAKRLIDYGFHAPTMSFPIAGALMIEPTECESPQEIERFCEALEAICEEARALAPGDQDNPLKNAPHTLREVCAEQWERPYSREAAAFPLPWVAHDKYWPPVKRVDDVLGDRNLTCTWPQAAGGAEAAGTSGGKAGSSDNGASNSGVGNSEKGAGSCDIGAGNCDSDARSRGAPTAPHLAESPRVDSEKTG